MIEFEGSAALRVIVSSIRESVTITDNDLSSVSGVLLRLTPSTHGLTRARQLCSHELFLVVLLKCWRKFRDQGRIRVRCEVFDVVDNISEFARRRTLYEG